MTFGFIRRHWGKGLLILVGLGLLGGTGFMTFIKIKFANFQPPSAAPGVIVTKVEGVPFSDRIEAIGTAEANESAALTATVTETVKSIVVPEGGLVKAGLEINGGLAKKLGIKPGQTVTNKSLANHLALR